MATRKAADVGCTKLFEYKAFAVAGRRLQKQCKGDYLHSAFAVLDQALVMLCSSDVSGTGDGLVPLLVPKLLAPRALAFVDSLATHAAHCAMANVDAHFAQSAVQCVSGIIDADHAAQAKRVHQKANKAKHDSILQLGRRMLGN